MKTTLHFEGPSDLSVGTIRIHGEGESVADWVATPGNLTFQTENIKPGLYATDIGPAGVAPQSVIFEVRAGEDNKVVLPPFSILSASGGNTSYFDTRSLQTFDRLPATLKLDLPERIVPAIAGAARPTPKEALRPDSATPLRLSRQTSRISVGLSEETRGPDSFDTFHSPVRMELFAGRVELDIPEEPQRDPWDARRVRLSTAIEQVRIERCLLPLYRGGTRITVSTPPFAPSDVEFNITPVDPHARALLRALDAGTSAEAEAVREHVVDQRLETEPSTAPDPWVAMLLGLLTVRFPQVFAPINHRWAASLAERAGWAFDAHVIHASQILAAARDKPTEARHEAVAEVVSLFARAQVAGSPYYRYTNQLFAEMADGIAHYLEQEAPRIAPAAVERFARVRRRWQREMPLQRGAGATFTWLARDPVALRERRILVPNRHPSGRLPAHSTLVVFEGELSAGKISLLRGHASSQRRAPAENGPFDETLTAASPFFHSASTRVRRGLGAAWSQGPSALLPRNEQPVSKLPGRRGPSLSSALSADPNRGQFGGRSHRDGFRLDARFEPAANSPQRGTVVLTVVAEDVTRIGLEDYACFVLHPSFSPAEVKVSFRAGCAQLCIQAWRGFTVGVRIPRAGVMLEYDLSELIKTR